MLVEGFRLMAVGMTTVFAFLSLLVVLMYGSAAFFRTFADSFPEPERAGAKPRPATAPTPAADADAELAVVLAAVAAHRARS